MALLAMPVIVINMGCEMMYILDQRLRAQNVPPDKGSRVLLDVYKTMFDISFIKDKLCVPQMTSSVQVTRRIFDRLAHSSIMRLSEASMDKLFDLMMMGVKFQLAATTRLEEMLEVTMIHVNAVKALLGPCLEGEPADQAANVESCLYRLYGGLSAGQQYGLRQALLRFFQDKRIKVSIFLQEGIQLPSGKLVLPSPLASGVGGVTYYEDGQAAGRQQLRLACHEADRNEFYVHPLPLGENLYAKDREKVAPPPRKGDEASGRQLHAAPSAAAAAGGSGAGAGARTGGHPSLAAGPSFGKMAALQPSASMSAREAAEVSSPSARSELTLLSSLMSAPKPAAEDNFKLNLFGDGDGDDGLRTEAVPGLAAKTTVTVPTLTFDGKGESAALARVIKDFSIGEDSKDSKGPQVTTGDDLLELMDSVS